MKKDKINLILYLKLSNLNLIMYLIAALIVIIPMFIVAFSDITLSEFYSKLMISIALTFVIIGKSISVFKKSKGDKSIAADIGIITGILIVLISHLVK